jgi:hypothetical protein
MSRIHTHTNSDTIQYVTNSYTYVQSESFDVPDGEIDNVKGHLAALLLLFFDARCFYHALALDPHNSRAAQGESAGIHTRTKYTHTRQGSDVLRICICHWCRHPKCIERVIARLTAGYFVRMDHSIRTHCLHKLTSNSLMVSLKYLTLISPPSLV